MNNTDELYTSSTKEFSVGTFFIFLLLGLFAIATQNSLADFLPSSPPDWILIIIIFISLKSALWASVLAAFILGFLKDALGGGYIGLFQFTYIIIAFIVCFLKRYADFFNTISLIILTLVLSFVSNFLIITPVMLMFGWKSSNLPLFSLFISSLATSLLAPLCFVFFKKIFSR